MNTPRINRKGYTLTELLIVLVLIGILAGYILPRLSTQPEKARITEAVNILGAIRRAELRYYDENLNFVAIGDHCTSAGAQDFLDKLALKLPSCGAPQPTIWKYKVNVALTTTTPVKAQAVANRVGTNPLASLILQFDANGNSQWLGTEDYQDPGTGTQGKYWPFG